MIKPTCHIFSGLLALWGATAFANGATDGTSMQTEGKNTRVETRFGRGEWNAGEWIFVKSPRWSYIGAWVQEDDHIRNRTPEGVGEDQLIADRYFYAYMSMVRNTRYDTAAGLEVSVRVSFSHDQGPQIVLAGELGANEDGYPEYRDHYEFVLYAKGVNVWHHVYREGRPGWARVACARFPLQAGTAYELKVRVEPVVRSRNGPAESGRMVEVTVDGEHTFAFHAPEMPERVTAGLTGYASFNRFYHFAVDGRPEAGLPVSRNTAEGNTHP